MTRKAAQTLSNIAYTKRSLGDLAGARRTIDEALAYLPRTHSHIYLTWAKAAAGLIALDEAHFDECTRLLSEAREQARLAKLSLDIAGEILYTPGHSEDSVSVLLDDGQVFTGDLTDPRMVGPEDPDVVRASWQLLKDRGAGQVYAGHGLIRPLPALDA